MKDRSSPSVVGVIPARYGSVRFAGKPLTKILDKPLLQWVIEGAKESKSLRELFVATDDERIAHLASSLKVTVVMTDSNLPTGSDRVWDAIKNVDCDYVINIQGDEPLIRGVVLDELAGALREDVLMATLARPIRSLEELQNPSFAKIALNKREEALYFSRAPIPFPKDGKLNKHLKHIGLYGFKKEFLKEFCEQAPVDIEKTESLEQLRALWMGVPIKVVVTDYESWGVDTPEDVIRVEKLLRDKRSL